MTLLIDKYDFLTTCTRSSVRLIRIFLVIRNDEKTVNKIEALVRYGLSFLPDLEDRKKGDYN